VVSQKSYDDDPAVSLRGPVVHDCHETDVAESAEWTWQKKPLIDFLIATSHPSHFHSINLARNPSHYPLLARWMGSDVIARVQENWGAGVWYATMVQVEGQVSTRQAHRF
jgi:translocator assembly and maintenance protein 41